jgi:TetR/AcrR family tetracycline transcriptional repressor
MKLSREKIVTEAIALLYEQGLKQVTLRNLADRLDMKAPSLFWYIRNKDELLALISAEIFRQCVESIPSCPTWQTWLHHYGLSLWEAQCKAPDIPNLITQVNLGRETREALYQLLYDQLSPYGLDMNLVMKIQGSVQALVTGWTVLTNIPRAVLSEGDYSPLRDDMVRALDVLISGWETALGQPPRMT